MESLKNTMYEQDIIVIKTIPCIRCHKGGEIKVLRRDYDRWRSGELIQVAFPEMPPGDREQLINGVHGKCFDEMFKEEE